MKGLSRVRRYIVQWLIDENVYERGKTSTEVDDKRTTDEFGDWHALIGDYLHRAQILGFANPGGRQAVAKAATVMLGCLESVVRVYGELPEPGVSSGNNLDHLRSL